MAIWIRSQNKKELINTKRIEIDNDEIFAYQELEDGYIKIGSYETEERALEVLNDIEIFVCGKGEFGIVYRMPEK